MAKVLKNYKKTKELIDNDYPVISIRYDDEVFADLPICAVEYDTTYTKAVLLTEPNKIPVVIEAAELLQKLSKLTKYFFYVDAETGEVKEVNEKEANLSVRLPHNTDISKLAYYNGEIILLDNQEEIKGDN